MKDLAKWQTVSFISRGMAMALGLVQSFFIVRLLSVSEWGLIQIAVSVGGALGIYQHLGLASASTREISAAKDNKEIFKIFVTSAFIRYVVSIPIAVGLFLLSDKLAVNAYHAPEIALPLKVYSLVLLVQGFQSILNSVVAGTKRFRRLFLYQVGIAAVSVVIYIPLVLFYKVNGYFYALFLFNLVSTLILGFLAFKPLTGFMQMPTIKEFKGLFRELFSISLGIYLVKIIYTNWEKLGPNLLGLTITPELVGYFGFALLYSKKLMNISDAVTDVNLPVFSDKYVNERESFNEAFTKNFDKLFALIIFIGVSAIYWVPEIVSIAIGSAKYDPSLSLVLPLVYAFICYSFINIIKSSVIIPAKMVKEMILSFVVLIGGTVAFYFGLKGAWGNLLAMSYGMAIGAMLSLMFMAIASNIRLKFRFFHHEHIILLLQSIIIALNWPVANVYIKLGAYPIYALLFLWATVVAGFITKDDIAKVVKKIPGF